MLSVNKGGKEEAWWRRRGIYRFWNLVQFLKSVFPAPTRKKDQECSFISIHVLKNSFLIYKRNLRAGTTFWQPNSAQNMVRTFNYILQTYKYIYLKNFLQFWSFQLSSSKDLIYVHYTVESGVTRFVLFFGGRGLKINKNKIFNLVN